MRVSSAHAFDASLSALNRKQEQLAQTQEQIAQGKRVLKVSDDPVAAARAERALARMTQLEARQRALDASTAGLEQIESSLATAGDLVQQARDLIVAFSNVNASATSQAATVQSMKQIIGQVTQLMARTDSDGQPLFGETLTDAQRLSLEQQGVLTAGFDQQQVWDKVPVPGSSPASTHPVLMMLDDTLTALEATPAPNASDLKSHLANLESASDHLRSHRVRAGVMLNRAESSTAQLEEQALQARLTRAEAEDVDIVQAMTQLQSRQTGYEAALKTYAMVQGMSLFDYVNR